MKHIKVATSTAEYPASFANADSEYSCEYVVIDFPTIIDMTANVPIIKIHSNVNELN